MQLSSGMIFSAGLVVVACLTFCSCDPVPPGSENMSRPTRPKVFTSPEELRTYLEQLGNFYAIQGRPRFGKRTLSPMLAGYAREEPETFKVLPISSTDLLQILSSFAQNQD